jgi:hypothetical protein
LGGWTGLAAGGPDVRTKRAEYTTAAGPKRDLGFGVEKLDSAVRDGIEELFVRSRERA